MEDPHALPAGGQQFPSTRWSELLQLTDPEHPRYAETLNALISTYWKPAYHYIRALRRVQTAEAMDLTQQFFTVLLSRGDFGKLTPDRGSFRGFLKTSLRNFLVSADRRKAARRPKGDARLFDFDPVDVEWMQAATPVADDPEVAFDKAWARLVLLDSIDELRGALAEAGKALYFDLFHDYCVAPTGVELGEGVRLPEGEVSDPEVQAVTDPSPPPEAPTYSELAQRHGINEDAVRNYLRYARKTLRDIIRRRVRGYLDERADVEQELRFVLGA